MGTLFTFGSLVIFAAGSVILLLLLAVVARCLLVCSLGVLPGFGPRRSPV